MADTISELLQEIAFLQGGGQQGTTPIQRGVFEKSIESISPLVQTIANLKSIRREKERDRLLDFLLGEKVKTAQRENQPLSRVLGVEEPEALKETFLRRQKERGSQEAEKDVDVELENLKSLRDSLQIAPGSSFEIGSQDIDKRINQLENQKKSFSISPQEISTLEQMKQKREKALAPFGGEKSANISLGAAKELKLLREVPSKEDQFTRLVPIGKEFSVLTGLKEGTKVPEKALEFFNQRQVALLQAGNRSQAQQEQRDFIIKLKEVDNLRIAQRQAVVQSRQQMISLRANLQKVLSNEKVSDDIRDQARQQIEIIDKGFLPTPTEVTKPFLFFFKKKGIEFKPLNVIRKVLVKDNITGQQHTVVLDPGQTLDPSFSPLSDETPLESGEETTSEE